MVVDLSLVAAGRRSSTWSGAQETLVVAVGAGVAISAGVLASCGFGVHFIVLVGLLAGFLIGLADWRRAIYGLLAYLPFWGIPTVLLYPHVTPALLVKDLLSVVPAHVGFLAQQIAARRPVSYAGASIWPLAALAALVISQGLNLGLPNRLDARLRAVSASLLALIVWNFTRSFKGGFIAIDPMNVYFWLFVGVLANLVVLDTGPPEPRQEAAGA